MNKYEYLDDEYDFVDAPRQRKMKQDAPINNRMATLKRVEGAINRYRKEKAS